MPMPDFNTELGYARIIRAGGSVQRYHTARTLRGQTVADHSWGVAQLIVQVYPEASSTLLRAGMGHDISETVHGDIPAPAKWAHPSLAEAEHNASGHFNTQMGLNFPLTPQEYYILKWCDLMECLMWCAEEARMGNTYAVSMMQNAYDAISKKEPPTTQAAALLYEFENYVEPLLDTKEDWYA